MFPLITPTGVMVNNVSEWLFSSTWDTASTVATPRRVAAGRRGRMDGWWGYRQWLKRDRKMCLIVNATTGLLLTLWDKGCQQRHTNFLILLTCVNVYVCASACGMTLQFFFFVCRNIETVLLTWKPVFLLKQSERIGFSASTLQGPKSLTEHQPDSVISGSVMYSSRITSFGVCDWTHKLKMYLLCIFCLLPIYL